MLSPEELVSIKYEDTASRQYGHDKPNGRELAVLNETLNKTFAGVRLEMRRHMLYWMDEYGPMPTRQLSELMHSTYSPTEIGLHLHSLRSTGWVQPHTRGDNGRITEWRFDSRGR